MDEPELKIIDVFICKLRKKLCEATMEDIHRVLEHPTFDGLTSDRRTIQLTA